MLLKLNEKNETKQIKMNWLNLIKSIISFTASLTEYLKSKQYIEAGKAIQILESLENSKNVIIQANKIRSDANDQFDASNGVPDESDKYLRD